MSEARTPIHPIAVIGATHPMDFHVSTNRRLPMAVQMNFAVSRLEDPAVARGEIPVPMGDPPFAFVRMAVGCPCAQHTIEAIIQTLEDLRAPYPSIVACPPHDDWVEQADQCFLA